ncbi:hypothetical protein TraAM80_07337 [Trypanosoma rangeli]|uniref:Uncharacterized protein n=1 Tax=Trypanosoma rangeli TaxID=5698 RepID=A0A3R7N660_TRYRA|nr:uncharacterized protein TraAM80_07337 [Trypanosoma rangeli]RNF00874.1 hypothetical protein TraAM80_07337 [Trypanosoma rangeli]|eukprot:RNF00874.1 hypothetical protein TraAM80_07337 [Trypanosoma rangeli]
MTDQTPHPSGIPHCTIRGTSTHVPADASPPPMDDSLEPLNASCRPTLSAGLLLAPSCPSPNTATQKHLNACAAWTIAKRPNSRLCLGPSRATRSPPVTGDAPTV